MKFISKFLLLPLAILAQVSLGHAESAVHVVGGEIINLPAPKGFCITNQSTAGEAQFFAFVASLMQASQNKLIMVAVECGRLQRMRQGDLGKVPDYTLYYVPLVAEGMTFTGDQTSLRKGMCTEIRKQGSEALDGVKDLVDKKAKEMGQSFGINTLSYIGVIDEDEHGCYAAMVGNVRDNSGKSTIMSTIITSTIVRKKAIFFAHYAEYLGPETTTATLQAAKAAATELDVLNR